MSARSSSTDSVDLLEVHAAQVGKRCNVVTALLVARHHPIGGEPCSRDPYHGVPHRLKSSAAPVDHAVREGCSGLVCPGADCVIALGNDFLPVRNSRLGSWVILKVPRGTFAEFCGVNGRSLATAPHRL